MRVGLAHNCALHRPLDKSTTGEDGEGLAGARAYKGCTAPDGCGWSSSAGVRQSLLGLGLLAFDAAAAFASEDTERSQPLLSAHVGAQAQTCEEA